MALPLYNGLQMASRGIDDYRRKRDFGATPEPVPESGAQGAGELLFVVHRHEARRLHYDLRLQIGGVLKSFAVPRGFSYATEDKRLAVHTEDHPLGYLEFEGVIPQGQYGAGTMQIWDRGRWELIGPGDDAAEAVQSGELKVVLHGQRLRGEWHLVCTNEADRQWLLFKARDVYTRDDRGVAVDLDLSAAVRRDLPQRLRRMDPRASSGEPFDDPGWAFELDFDGVRCFALVEDGHVRWQGAGRGSPPEDLESELRACRARRVVFDGTLVALDDHGRPSSARLSERPEDVFFYVADVLAFDDLDLRGLPFTDRKALVNQVLPQGTRWLQPVDPVIGDGRTFARRAAGAGFESILAKRVTSIYTPGPSESWRRIELSAGAAADMSLDDALAEVRASEPGSRVRFTNLRKVWFPGEGITKGDVLGYYEQMAPAILPYLKDRAVHMRRMPDGIEGKAFYQRQPPENATPDWVRVVRLPSSHDPEEIKGHAVCDDRDTLLWLINLGSVDLHPWMSRVESSETPDYCVFDLDPKGAPFSDVVRIAKALGRVLRGCGLRPVVKTSGSSGMHVVVGLQPGCSYDQVRLFGEAVARVVIRETDDIATVERAVEQRGGKLYIDVLQNRRGQTVVPPYVVRPVSGACVSTPLDWDELDGGVQIADFHIRNVPARFAQRGDLFRGCLDDRQDLVAAIARLDDYLRGERHSRILRRT